MSVSCVQMSNCVLRGALELAQASGRGQMVTRHQPNVTSVAHYACEAADRRCQGGGHNYDINKGTKIRNK